MEYGWEKKARKALTKLGIALLGFGKREEFWIVGIAVENTETGEAALLRFDEAAPGEILVADISGDILGDAQKHYDLTLEIVFSDAPRS